jgi:phage anti-repressor protein
MFEIQLHNQVLSGDVKETVSGRDIHGALDINRGYAHWVRDQINSLQLIENVDYVVLVQNDQNPQGGRPASQYYFTIDIAKHIALASRTPKGREYRQALIDLEQRTSDTMPIIKNPATKIAIDTLIRIDAVEQRQEAMEIEMDRAQKAAFEALAAQRWMSIRQYVVIHEMTRQLPPGTAQQQYGRWLTGYCREKGLPMYKQQGEQFSEWTYPVWSIQETIYGWLSRHYSQGRITGMEIDDDGIWYHTDTPPEGT